MAREDCFAKELEESYNRQKINWEAVIDKYNRHYPACDELDLKSMSIHNKSGFIKHMKPCMFGKTKLAVTQKKDCTYLLDQDETFDLDANHSKLSERVRNASGSDDRYLTSYHSDGKEVHITALEDVRNDIFGELSNAETLSTANDSESEVVVEETPTPLTDEEWEDILTDPDDTASSDDDSEVSLVSLSLSSDSSGYCDRFYALGRTNRSVRRTPAKSWLEPSNTPQKVSTAINVVRLDCASALTDTRSPRHSFTERDLAPRDSVTEDLSENDSKDVSDDVSEDLGSNSHDHSGHNIMDKNSLAHSGQDKDDDSSLVQSDPSKDNKILQAKSGQDKGNKKSQAASNNSKNNKMSQAQSCHGKGDKTLQAKCDRNSQSQKTSDDKIASERTPVKRADTTFIVLSNKKPTRKIEPIRLSSNPAKEMKHSKGLGFVDVCQGISKRNTHKTLNDGFTRCVPNVPEQCSNKQTNNDPKDKWSKVHTTGSSSSSSSSITSQELLKTPRQQQQTNKRTNQILNRQLDIIKPQLSSNTPSSNYDQQSISSSTSPLSKETTTTSLTSSTDHRTPRARCVRSSSINPPCYTEQQIYEYLNSPQCKTLPGLPSGSNELFTPSKSSPGTSHTSRQIQEAMKRLRIMSSKKNSTDKDEVKETKPAVCPSRKKLLLTPRKTKHKDVASITTQKANHATSVATVTQEAFGVDLQKTSVHPVGISLDYTRCDGANVEFTDTDSVSEVESTDVDGNSQNGSLADIDSDEEESASETLHNTPSKPDDQCGTPERTFVKQTQQITKCVRTPQKHILRQDKVTVSPSPSTMLGRLKLRAVRRATHRDRDLQHRDPLLPSADGTRPAETVVHSPATTSTPNKRSQRKALDISNISMIVPLSKHNGSHSKHKENNKITLPSTGVHFRASNPKQYNPTVKSGKNHLFQCLSDVKNSKNFVLNHRDGAVSAEDSPDVYAFSSSDSERMFDFSDRSLLRESEQELFNMSTPSGHRKQYIKKGAVQNPSVKAKLEFPNISSSLSQKRRRSEASSSESEDVHEPRSKKSHTVTRHTSEETVPIKEEEEDDIRELQSVAHDKMKVEKSLSLSISCPGPDLCTKSFCFSCVK